MKDPKKKLYLELDEHEVAVVGIALCLLTSLKEFSDMAGLVESLLLLGIKVNGCDDSLIAGVSGGVPIPRLLDGVHATQKERMLCMKKRVI